MNIISKIRKHGLVGTVKIVLKIMRNKIRPLYYKLRYIYAPVFIGPTQEELITIESDLQKCGVKIKDFSPNPTDFKKFQDESWFPLDYHGGQNGGVWDEKLLEHWIAYSLLGLREYNENDIYIDVAAGSSPWVKSLRERQSISAYAIDLSPVNSKYSELPYYRMENAIQSNFSDDSVSGVSLQCAYEMFNNNDDTLLIEEFSRILKPGGKAVILPLYMHTQYCSYSTPEYFGKGYSDPNANEYIRMDCYGVPSSRKYDSNFLMQRVIKPILKAGLRYEMLVLRNKKSLGENIYCHFILVIEK